MKSTDNPCSVLL